MPRGKILVCILYFHHYQILLIVAQPSRCCGQRQKPYLVPAMQKGNGTARNLHIALNAINVVLSCGRSPLELTWFSKVFELTKWPWIIATPGVSFLTNQAGILSAFISGHLYNLHLRFFHFLPLWLSVFLSLVHKIKQNELHHNALDAPQFVRKSICTVL